MFTSFNKTVRKRRKKYIPPEIEDVSEAFCGKYRVNMILLSEANEVVASEWFYKKNCGWTPDDFSHGSQVKAWWQCPNCLNIYKSTIANRIALGSACPFCASKKVYNKNALSVLFPEIAAEWHPSKNGKRKATDFTQMSSKRAWWLCSKCGHEWNSIISTRTGQGAGCPSCYAAKVQYQKEHYIKAVHVPIVLGETKDVPREWYENNNYISLAKSHPKVAKQWHPNKNGSWRPKDFSQSSGVTAWWKCARGPDHEWQATIAHRTRLNRGCPFCAGQRVSLTNSLQYLHPQIAKEWHSKLNGVITPADVTSGTDRKVWWQCKRFPDHYWEAAISSRVKGRTGCPQCAGTKVSAQNCLQNQFPSIAAQWHPTKNQGLRSDAIGAKSGKKVWWICHEGPDHEWQARPSDRTLKGSGCPCCRDRKLSITNCLATVYPHLAKQWDKKKNGRTLPTNVLHNSKEVVWWVCEAGHSWQQAINNRTRRSGACSRCKKVKTPQAKTRAAMEEADQIVSARRARFKSSDALIADLEKNSKK